MLLIAVVAVVAAVAVRLVLLAQLRDDNLGGECVDLGIVRDAPVSSLRSAISAAAAACDIVVTTGGVSVGAADHIKAVLADMPGCELLFGRINMKPGKPSTCALISRPDGGKCIFFGLPGNPASCLVCKCLLVEPAIKVTT